MYLASLDSINGGGGGGRDLPVLQPHDLFAYTVERGELLGGGEPQRGLEGREVSLFEQVELEGRRKGTVRVRVTEQKCVVL